MKLTQTTLKEILHYDLETGVFTWNKPPKYNSNLTGSEAGYIDSYGYRVIRIDGKKYRAHRLAFLYVVDEIPHLIDHINRVRSDNRWGNLRCTDRSGNRMNAHKNKNNTSGYRGVYWSHQRNNWFAQTSKNGKRVYLGSFDCKHQAFCEYVLATRKLFGNFAPF